MNELSGLEALEVSPVNLNLSCINQYSTIARSYVSDRPASRRGVCADVGISERGCCWCRNYNLILSIKASVCVSGDSELVARSKQVTS